MVIISYSPEEFKFLSNSYLENLTVIPSFIYGNNSNLNKIDIKNIITNLYSYKYDLNKDININNINLKYLMNNQQTILNNIINKTKQTTNILQENKRFNRTFSLSLPNFLLSSNNIISILNQYKNIIILNVNYIDVNNYDIINILFVLFKFIGDSSEKTIFNTKNIEFQNIII